jgi:hypothetical protein
MQMHAIRNAAEAARIQFLNFTSRQQAFSGIASLRNNGVFVI